MTGFAWAAWLMVAAAISSAGTTNPPRWGVDGHKIVAEIALERLTPAAANETRRLLGGQNIPDIASWADDVRRSLPNTGPWHYIDIEIGDTSYVPARDCKENACVIWALESRIAILADRTQPDSARASARSSLSSTSSATCISRCTPANTRTRAATTSR